MKPITFSEKLMRKYGRIILDLFEKRTLHKVPISYRIDYRNENTVKLSDWLSASMEGMNPKIIEQARKLAGESNDESVINVLRWVYSSIKYVPDSVKWHTIEKWQTPSETFESLSGDCEDGAVLMYAMLSSIEVSPTQLRINAGDVIGGGHCWLEYRSDTTGKPYYIDWCYDIDLSRIVDRYDRTYHEKYKRIWWCFNNFSYYKGYVNV